MVAGLRGSAGKTFATIAMTRALRDRGLEVAPFKKGPDYIDPGWHTFAAGRACRNLDTYLVPPNSVRESFLRGARGADLALVEANRGLFDGIEADGTKHDAAGLAKLLECPVLLVVDCAKVSTTAAATVLGCTCYDEDLSIAGVILNRVCGDRHERVLRRAFDGIAMPVLGAFPRLREAPFGERHLGLLPPQEHDWALAAVDRVGELATKHLDLDAILEIARSASPWPHGPAVAPGSAAPVARVGVFRDAAFHFYYPENLEALEACGCALVPIDSLRDEALPDVDALYIGGGFPETHARPLASNRSLREAVRGAAEAGLPIYAECGGLMYLVRALLVDGERYPMAGIFPLDLAIDERPQGHGYTDIEVVGENPWFEVGTSFRGHEFHYSRPVVPLSAAAAGDLVFRVRRGRGIASKRDGLCTRNVLATYTHLHALGVAGWAKALASLAIACRETNREAASCSPGAAAN